VKNGICLFFIKVIFTINTGYSHSLDFVPELRSLAYSTSETFNGLPERLIFNQNPCKRKNEEAISKNFYACFNQICGTAESNKEQNVHTAIDTLAKTVSLNKPIMGAKAKKAKETINDLADGYISKAKEKIDYYKRLISQVKEGQEIETPSVHTFMILDIFTPDLRKTLLNNEETAKFEDLKKIIKEHYISIKKVKSSFVDIGKKLSSVLGNNNKALVSVIEQVRKNVLKTTQGQVKTKFQRFFLKKELEWKEVLSKFPPQIDSGLVRYIIASLNSVIEQDSLLEETFITPEYKSLFDKLNTYFTKKIKEDKESFIKNLENRIRQHENDIDSFKQNKDSLVSQCFNNTYLPIEKYLPKDPQLGPEEIVEKAYGKLKSSFLKFYSTQTQEEIEKIFLKRKVVSPKTGKTYLDLYPYMINDLRNEIASRDSYKGIPVHFVMANTRKVKNPSRISFDDIKPPSIETIFSETCSTMTSKINIVSDSFISPTVEIDDKNKFDNRFLFSLFSLQNPKIGVEIHTHEAGHFISRLWALYSPKSQNFYKSTRSCLNEIHGTHKKSTQTPVQDSASPPQKPIPGKGSEKFLTTDKDFTEEDWADLVKSFTYRDQIKPDDCLFLKVKKNYAGLWEYRELPLELPFDGDPHSTNIFRVLHAYEISTGKPIRACQEYVKLTNSYVREYEEMIKGTQIKSCLNAHH
jgi:hypothetical protein